MAGVGGTGEERNRPAITSLRSAHAGPGTPRSLGYGRIWKTHGWQHPRASAKRLWKERSTGAAPVFLGETRVGLISTRRRKVTFFVVKLGAGLEG